MARIPMNEATSLTQAGGSKKSDVKHSLTPYKHEKEKGYTIIVQNLRSSLKNKEELYEYLLRFGDICRFNYIDNSKIDKRINPRKDIMVSYTTEGGFRRASRGKHRDLQMYTPTMIENKEAYHEHRSSQHPRQDEE